MLVVPVAVGTVIYLALPFRFPHYKNCLLSLPLLLLLLLLLFSFLFFSSSCSGVHPLSSLCVSPAVFKQLSSTFPSTPLNSAQPTQLPVAGSRIEEPRLDQGQQLEQSSFFHHTFALQGRLASTPVETIDTSSTQHSTLITLLYHQISPKASLSRASSLTLARWTLKNPFPRILPAIQHVIQ